MADSERGDLTDFSDLSDDELRQVVLEHLGNSPELDLEDIDVDVRDGAVVLSGRVGTDSEVRIAGAVLDDLLGLDEYKNDLVVDALRRGDDRRSDSDRPDRLADGPEDHQSDTADHLVEDLDAEMHGTEDVGQAIRDGTAYNPPDRPVADGYGSLEKH